MPQHLDYKEVPLVVDDTIYAVKEHVSHGQVDLFSRCGHRYFKDYIEGAKAWEETLPTAAGTAVHEVIEEYERERRDDPILPLFQKRLRDVEDVEGLEFWGKKDLRWWTNKGLPLIADNYARLRAVERSKGIVPVSWEDELLWTTPHGQLFTGSVDAIRIRTSDGKAILIDWKTGKQKDAHQMQLELYRVAVEELGLHDVAFGQVVYLSDKNGFANTVMPHLSVEVASKIIGHPREGTYPYTGVLTGECGFCPHRGTCPVGTLGDTNVLLTK